MGEKLEPSARLPFALTTAGNLIISAYRVEARARRHQHRLLDRDHPDDPAENVLALEQAAAVRAALDRLPDSDRRMLQGHADGRTTAELAEAADSTPAAVAARLARTRARLRVDYLLALRRVDLPSVACRRVLLAVSAADLRRQRSLDAAGHLAACPTCVDLLPPLVERRSRLAGVAVAPLVGLGALGGRLHGAARAHPVQSAVAATVTGAAVAGAAVALSVTASDHRGTQPAAAVRPAPVTDAAPRPSGSGGAALRTASGVALVPLPSTAVLRTLAGQRVTVRALPVQSVVSHPGFWLSVGTGRLYVHIADPADVLRAVRAGERLSFTAVLAANPAGFAAADGVSGPEDAALLTRQRVHLVVTAAELLRR